jgi:GNAT superfamily N-acetyltransferase
MVVPVEIKLIPKDKLVSIIPFIKELNPNIPESTLKTRIDEMVVQGYQCAGLYNDGILIGICGLWVMTKFYVGKHIEPDNVFILPEYRHQGLGKKLLEWVYGYGLSQGCIASKLNCYINNDTGNAFWEQEGFAKIGYHYQKYLESS